MDRDVSIEGIHNSKMWNVHDSPRKWVDDQGLPDGTTTEMVKNKTRRANEKREIGKKPKVKVVQVCDVPSDAGLKKGPWAVQTHVQGAMCRALMA